MIEIDIVQLVSQTGFPIAVATYLLWRGHVQDREYLKALQELTSLLKEHIRQKDEAIQLLKEKA